MPELTLSVCPICFARNRLSPKTMERGERSFVWYECAECNSVLLSAGDDRWIYQKIGREDQEHLLKQPMTEAELAALVEVPEQPSVEPEPPVEVPEQPSVEPEPLVEVPEQPFAEPEPPVEVFEPPPAVPEPPVASAPTLVSGTPGEPVTPPPEKKKRGPGCWVLLAIAAIVVCLACVVVSLVVWRSAGEGVNAIATQAAEAEEALTRDGVLELLGTPGTGDAAEPGATQVPADAPGADSTSIPADAPQPTETSAPAEAPGPTDPPAQSDAPAPAPGGVLEPSSIAAPAILSSYRSFMSIAITQIVDGQQSTELTDFETAYTSDPLAQYVSVSGTGNDAPQGMERLEWYLVADTIYMALAPGEWISLPISEGEDLVAGLITPDAILDETCGWQSQGTTTLDGIEVERYTTSKAQMDACMTVEQLYGIGNLTDAGGEMFIARDGSYVVQMDLFYAGSKLDLGSTASGEPLGEGRLEISYRLSDVNQDFSIDLPPGAQAAASGPEDIPIPDNAQEIVNMGSLITFNSPEAPAQVAEYYRSQMPNLGWTEAGVEDVSGMIMLEFAKEGKTAALMLQPVEAGGTTTLITLE